MGLPEKRDEVSPMAGPKKARRAATLHSGVFHFNGPPGDWLTPTGDPSPFRHNGPLHYLFVLANVLLARTKPLVFHVLPFPRAINRTSREQGYRRIGNAAIGNSCYIWIENYAFEHTDSLSSKFYIAPVTQIRDCENVQDSSEENLISTSKIFSSNHIFPPPFRTKDDGAAFADSNFRIPARSTEEQHAPSKLLSSRGTGKN